MPHLPASVPTTHPDFTFGQDTFSSSAATSLRSETPCTRVANSSCENPATLTISGTGRVASTGRSCSRNPARPLFGRPIELISPAGVSHRRGGGLPPRGASVIVFETKAEKGKRRADLVPEGPQRRDRVEGAGAVQDRMFELDAGKVHPQVHGARSRDPGVQCQSSASSAALTTGPSTHSRRNPCGSHDAAEAGAEAARHACLQGELRLDARVRRRSA